jgi:hypothetical protein
LSLAGAVVVGCGAIVPFVPDRILNLFVTGGAVSLNLFTPIQLEPRSEDSAGPHFAVAGDLDGDGLTDVVTAWNESKSVQLHFHRPSPTGLPRFEALTLAGDFPISIVSGLAIEDMDQDGNNDVVVLIKESGVFARCRESGEVLGAENAPAGLIMIYFAPRDPALILSPLAWNAVKLSQSETAGAPPSDPQTPELGGYTDMVLADIDGANGQDIIVAWNANECEGGGNRVEYYRNPGPGLARQSTSWAPFLVEVDAPAIKSVAAFDVDRDGDLDIAATYPTARGASVRWLRNPRIDVPDAFHLSDGTWQRGSIGRLEVGTDIIEPGDLDQDGIMDVVVRSTNGRLIMWFRGPEHPTTAPVRNVPWQSFTIAEFKQRVPETISLGDIDGDGQLEVFVSAGGGLIWFDIYPGSTVYDQWQEFVLADENPATTSAPPVTDPNVNRDEVEEPSTFINTISVVDLDGDGLPDVLGTLDRRGMSGTANDAVVWYRNNGF